MWLELSQWESPQLSSGQLNKNTSSLSYDSCFHSSSAFPLWSTQTCTETRLKRQQHGSHRHVLSSSAGLALISSCQSHSGAGGWSLAASSADLSVRRQVQSESTALLLHLRERLGCTVWMLRPGCCFQEILLHHIPWLCKGNRLVYACLAMNETNRLPCKRISVG